MQTFYKVCLILMIIGGINWGLVGLFQFDFVGWLLGGSSSIWSRIVFTVVGVAAVCVIRVSDTGCGIPEKYQQSIFQPFFRVDKSRSREYGGAGLGLSLVWEIADLHGGSVWVEESSDKGTTIAVELPTQQSTKP